MKIWLLLAVMFWRVDFGLAQDVTAQTSDGRKVILHADKTWEFAPVTAPEKASYSESRERQPIKTCEVVSPLNLTVRGLRLGMTREEVRNILRIPKGEAGNIIAKFSKDKNSGLGSLIITLPSMLENKEFANVSDLRLKVVDNVLTQVRIYYLSTARWNNAAEFASSVASLLRIPDEWKEAPSLYGLYQNYQGVTINVSTDIIELVYQPCLDLVAERQNAINEKKKNAFKP